MRFFVIVSLFLCAAITTAGQTSASISDLAGLAGCWERSDEAKQMSVSEQWMKPAGGAMLGMGRTLRSDKLADWEFMRIEQRVDGALFFVARPRANNEDTEFKMISSKPGEFVFENSTHDFPQRVIYRFSRDAMSGRIEGKMNGREIGIDFPFKKVKCG